MAHEANHLPSFKDQVQSALAPNDEPPVEEAAKESSKLVTFKDQHRPHELEHEPPQQHRQHQSQRNALGEDTIVPASGDGSTAASEQHQSMFNGSNHLPSGEGGSNTSGLLLQAQAVDSQLEEERVQRAVQRELQSQPAVHTELMEQRCSRRSMLLIALLAIVVIVGVTTATVIVNQGKSTDNLTTGPSPVPVPSTMPVLRTETPSAMPVLSTPSAAIATYIKNITLASNPIRYPLPQGETPTPEEQALDWLINEDPLNLTVEQNAGRRRLSQRFALLTLWFSTNGPEWTNKNFWLEDQDECNWQGIDCDSEKSVWSIGAEESLQNNEVIGSIPADLALLTNCLSIDLGLNPGVGGTIPTSLTTMANLKFLYLNG